MVVISLQIWDSNDKKTSGAVLTKRMIQVMCPDISCPKNRDLYETGETFINVPRSRPENPSKICRSYGLLRSSLIQLLYGNHGHGPYLWMIKENIIYLLSVVEKFQFTMSNHLGGKSRCDNLGMIPAFHHQTDGWNPINSGIKSGISHLSTGAGFRNHPPYVHHFLRHSIPAACSSLISLLLLLSASFRQQCDFWGATPPGVCAPNCNTINSCSSTVFFFISCNLWLFIGFSLHLVTNKFKGWSSCFPSIMRL